MCGMAGIAGLAGPIHSYYGIAGMMLERLTRNGPDDGGIVFSKGSCLLHCRLADSDAQNGSRPMELLRGDKRYIISYSGELYNAEEVRRRLEERGFRFKSHADSEILLAAFAEWGTDCVQALNGAYAFAIWEEQSETLFCARDHFGLKPFFYALEKDMFIFGSEIKVVLAHPFVEPVVDSGAVAELMLIGPGRTPGCGIFQGVHSLKPGHCATFDKEGLRVWSYHELKAAEHHETLEETAAHVRELLTDAIRRQLTSGTTLCTLLSGGLDSSIVSAVARQHLPDGALQTFSVDYLDNALYFKESKFQPGSDAHYIQIMNEHLGCRHTTIELDTKSLVESLFLAVDARDLPGMADVDGSLLLFCREIKPFADVALSGECADEIFGGYPWYRDQEIRDTDGFPWSQSTAYRASFLKEGILGGIDPAAYVYEKYKDTIQHAGTLDSDSPLERRMKEMMRLNVDWFMQTLLDRTERMSAYNKLTVRVPFCDHRLVEYLYNVPWEYKDYQGREKGLLRYAMRSLLPDEVLWRKKSPYPKTHHPEYLATVSALLREILHLPGSPLLELVKKDAIEQLLSDSRATPWYGQLMTTPQTIAYFIQLNYWMQKFKIKLK